MSFPAQVPRALERDIIHSWRGVGLFVLSMYYIWYLWHGCVLSSVEQHNVMLSAGTEAISPQLELMVQMASRA